MGTKLPRKLEQKMQVVGEQIKLARLRRAAQESERGSGGGMGNLFSTNRVTHRKRYANGSHRHLSPGALRPAIG